MQEKSEVDLLLSEGIDFAVPPGPDEEAIEDALQKMLEVTTAETLESLDKIWENTYHVELPQVAEKWTREHVESLKHAATDLAMQPKSQPLRVKYEEELKKWNMSIRKLMEMTRQAKSQKRTEEPHPHKQDFSKLQGKIQGRINEEFSDYLDKTLRSRPQRNTFVQVLVRLQGFFKNKIRITEPNIMLKIVDAKYL